MCVCVCVCVCVCLCVLKKGIIIDGVIIDIINVL